MGSRLGGRGDQRRVRAAARAAADARARAGRADRARPRARRFGTRRGGAQATVQGRWSLTDSIFRREPDADPGARRRALAELLLERYGIVTREQVLAEGIPGGFSILYDALAQLETLGVCRRGYFVEGLGGAQFALPGAVERLRAQRDAEERAAARARRDRPGAALRRRAAVAQARRRGAAAARVAGAYVVLAGAEPVALRRARRQAASRCSSTAATRGCAPRSRRSPRSSRPAAGASSPRARRRRAGRRLGARAAARRARLPPGPAQAHAERVGILRGLSTLGWSGRMSY